MKFLSPKKSRRSNKSPISGALFVSTPTKQQTLRKRKRFLLFKPFSWLFPWKTSKKKSSPSSPDSTASLEDYAELDDVQSAVDPYIFSSSCDASETAIAPVKELFPYWEEEVDSKGQKVDIPLEKNSKTSKPNSLRKSLKRLVAKEMTHEDVLNATLEDDESSYHFSISSDRRQSTVQPTPTRTSTCTPDNNEGGVKKKKKKKKKKQSDDNTVSSSRVSLQDFMSNESKSKNKSPASINLGEISAAESTSVSGSAFMTVSYDEDYPQLVLQETCSEMAESIASELLEFHDDFCVNFDDNASGLLGVTFPHPAPRTLADQLSSSHSTEDDNGSYGYSGWLLNKEINRIWNEVDREDAGRELNINYTSSEWEERDDVIRWSCSKDTDGSVRTNKDEGFFEPILNPLCRFVEATELPSCNNSTSSSKKSTCQLALEPTMNPKIRTTDETSPDLSSKLETLSTIDGPLNSAAISVSSSRHSRASSTSSYGRRVYKEPVNNFELKCFPDDH